MVARILMLCLCCYLVACKSEDKTTALDVASALGGIPATGFARALEPRQFSFPADHAAHPDFRNEWWYVTGNVQDASDRQFGYQVTLFRIALTPSVPSNPSAWATNQMWMAHVALTDLAGQQHLHEQRFARGAAGLAGQSAQPFRVWLEDWQILGQANGQFPWSIQVKAQDFKLNLTLAPTKPAVLQGNQGLSQKSSEAGNASYYYSFTRLETTGTIHYQGKDWGVAGLSWLDREWSTSALGADQAGWDWFSLQLKDGQELMFYRMRKKSGEADAAHSQGKLVLADGSSQTLSLNDVQLKPLEYWQAPTGARYPIAWELTRGQTKWRVEAVVKDQLMQTSVLYWEGSVHVVDANTGQVLGMGYLEMSGY
ncbi:MAG: carotenoid 1,2-hydratase [Thiothrix sp.]|nr:MAG: carotenoid 1,2-hydratase [Thiothrix sp.]